MKKEKLPYGAVLLFIAAIVFVWWGWNMSPESENGRAVGTAFTFAAVSGYMCGILFGSHESHKKY